MLCVKCLINAILKPSLQVHYCALPIEAEAPIEQAPTARSSSAPAPRRAVLPLYATPPPLGLRAPPGAASDGNPANAYAPRGLDMGAPPPSWYSSLPLSRTGFDGSLRLALLCSALLNALFGSVAYATFGRAAKPPEADGYELEGCDDSRPFMCDDVVKNVAAGPAQVFYSQSCRFLKRFFPNSTLFNIAHIFQSCCS